MKDLAWFGVFLLLIAGSNVADSYAERMKRDDCHRVSGARWVHIEGEGCSFDKDFCEEPKP